MEEDSLANILREGEDNQNILDSVEKELEVAKPAESLPDKEIEKLELPDEEKLASQKRNSAFEEMRVKNETLEARLASLEKEESPEKSEFVSSLVGDNEDVEAKWAKERESLKEEIKRETIQDQLDAQEKKRVQDEHWKNWTQERFDEVEKEFKVDFKADENLKNELSVIMRDVSPTDEQGNLDYRKGMKLLNDLNKVKVTEKHASTQVKKDIADATVSKETSVQKNKDFLTSHDIRKAGGWRGLTGDY